MDARRARGGGSALAVVSVVLWAGGCPPQLDYRDCLLEGSCDCRGPGDCPPGQACVNGRCTTAPDAGGSLLGFGETCRFGDDCGSGYCVTAASGHDRVCSTSCRGDCPDGWVCKPSPAHADLGLCVQDLQRLCYPCSVDAHCHPAFGDYCVALGSVQVCGRSCTFEPCPQGYRCDRVEVAGGMVLQCVPATGSCSCGSENIGLERACLTENVYGGCFGLTSCLLDGAWSACSGRQAEPETCNGVDDDCDGLVDGSDDSIAIEGLPLWPPYPNCQVGGSHACVGAWSCRRDDLDRYAWQCDATAPQPEVCDGEDNDCDGQVDEDYRDDAGRYRDVEHCGACGYSCLELISDLALDENGEVMRGAAMCDLRGEATWCRPLRCLDGYAPYPEGAPLTCLHLATPQCRSCTQPRDCLLSVDRCAAVGDDRHASCLQGCGIDAPYGDCTGVIGQRGCCTAHHRCELVDGDPVCIPEGNSCDCNADRVGSERACYLDGSGGTVCLGLQLCEIDPVTGPDWSVCDASTTALEVCDGVDNDCNGLADDPYLDSQGTGTYDVDHHCGTCSTDCEALWSSEIQHAVGGCVVEAGEPGCAIVRCTTARLAAGGWCRDLADCNTGFLCDEVLHLCRRPCHTTQPCPQTYSCVDGFCAYDCHVGADHECVELIGAAGRCVDGRCLHDVVFHDADSVASNGCECLAGVDVREDPPDLFASYPAPGDPYRDADCDGVDGDADRALFVWAGASAPGQGTRGAPFPTIGQALLAFRVGQHAAILVATGTYVENLTLRAGVRLYGGYATDFSRRDVVLFPAIVAGTEPDPASQDQQPGVINAVGINGAEVVVAGFLIYGYDVTRVAGDGEDGVSSYAVYLRDVRAPFTLANSVIFAGRGGDGGPGLVGSAGRQGASGRSGLNSAECVTTSCSGESQGGGSGGANPGCEAAGAPGGDSRGDVDPQRYRPPLGNNGAGGSNGTYTSDHNPEWAHLCKYDCQVADDMNGDDARDGREGIGGDAGAGCTDGTGAIVGGLWQAEGASPGAGGGQGSGGGGGGAGGCVQNINPASCTVGNRVGDLGATGGGGGAGGCGGVGGWPGGAGGGSFAVFIAVTSGSLTAPELMGNVILRGQGGAGGDGGYGGQGGAGGEGGAGGLPVLPAWCAGLGGKGGRGGHGGGGGGGGGGCGGPSLGVTGIGLPVSVYLVGNEFVADELVGSGGPGGRGGATPTTGAGEGGDGATGWTGDVHAF